MTVFSMTIEEAKVYQQKLNEKVDAYSAKLNTFEKGMMGLTPDHVRETPEWKEANNEFKKSFVELRNFNQWYVKTFMKKKNKRKMAQG